MIGHQQKRPPGGGHADPRDPDAEQRAGGAVIQMRNDAATAEPDRDPLRRNGGKDERDPGAGAQRGDQVLSFGSSGTA